MQPEGNLLSDFHTDLSVGDILRRARLRCGYTLDDIEQSIKITKDHLLAIEEGRLEDLPGRIYALGFIRSYAEFLNLDGAKILQLLKRQTGKKLDPLPMSAPEIITDDPTLPSGKTFLTIAALFILSLSAGPSLLAHLNGKAEESVHGDTGGHIPAVPNDLKQQMTLLSKPVAQPSPPVVVEGTAPQAVTVNSQSLSDLSPSLTSEPLQTSEAPVAATTNNNATVAPVVDTNAQHAVVLKATESVWLEIRDPSGTTVFSRVLSTGEEYWVPANQAGLVMTLGNAGGLQIMVEGIALPPLGKTGKVLRNIGLDASSLKERLKNLPKKAM